MSEPPSDGRVVVTELTKVFGGHLAFAQGVEVHELRLDRFELEQLFFALTRGQYAGTEPTAPGPDGGAAWSA